MVEKLSFFVPGIAFVVAFIFLTVRAGWLTRGGAISAALLGCAVVFFAGLEWLIPLFFFFISGSLLGKIHSKALEKTDEKHGSGRDTLQIICNGLPYGLAAIIAWFFPEKGLLMMSVSIAVGVADTWSSEIGMYFRGTTVDILKLKKQPPGISGGISFAGTFGGLAGAILTAAICVYLMELKNEIFIIKSIHYFFVIMAAGFAGMLLDSVLGSAFQIRFKNQKTGMLSDAKSKDSAYHSGYFWMTNDVVNLLSNALMTLIAFFIN